MKNGTVMRALAVLALSQVGNGQESLNGGVVVLGPLRSNGSQAVVDFTAAASTSPVKSGPLAARPGTCTAGQMYFATDASAGQNLALCTSAGAWAIVAGGGAGVNGQAGSGYAFLDGDYGKLVTFSNPLPIGVSLPQAGVSSRFAAGWVADVQNRGAGSVTITPATSTIDGAALLVLTQNQGARIFSDGANYFTERGVGGGSGSGGANASGFYLVNQAANAPASAVNLGALSTGLFKLTISGGVATPSTAVAGTDYQAPLTNPVTSTGSAGSLPKLTGAGTVGNSNLSENADGSDNAARAITWAPAYKPVFSAGGTTTCDLSQSNICEVDFGAGNTTLAVSNPHGSGLYLLRSCQDATGGRTYTFPGTAKGFSQPDPSAGATNCTEQPFSYDGSGYRGGAAAVPNSAWHGLSAPEGSACTGAVNTDCLYADTAAHRWKAINNNGTANQVVLSGGDIDATDHIAANAVGSGKMAVVNTRHTCSIVIGADNGTALGTADIAPQGRQCFVPAAATVVEITVSADAPGGTPAVVVAKNHAGVQTALNASLATAAAGGLACANAAGTGLSIDGATTCAVALTTTALAAGDWLETQSSASASTAKRMSISITYTVL